MGGMVDRIEILVFFANCINALSTSEFAACDTKNRERATCIRAKCGQGRKNGKTIKGHAETGR